MTGTSTHGSWRNEQGISHANETILKIKGPHPRAVAAEFFSALNLFCFRALVEWLNKLTQNYTNKHSLPTFHCLETERNKEFKWSIWVSKCFVQEGKCLKESDDTIPRADILIKAKGCFVPLSSIKNLIVEEQCLGIRGPGKSNIMFWNIATANSTATRQDYLNSRAKNGISLLMLLILRHWYFISVA